MPTNLFTEISVDDRSFSIRKFDCKTGLKLARLIIGKAAPIIPLLDKATNGEGDNQFYNAVGSILISLDDADIESIMDKSLRVCFENLPAGRQPIIDEMGHYGVEDIEYNLPLALRLCAEAIKWGASDFFGEKSSALKQMFNLAG